MKPAKYKLLKQIFMLRDTSLLVALTNIMKQYYEVDKVHATTEYLYVEGEVPVMLLAHLDTVHPAPPSLWFHDSENHILWSPNGLGADDRAGVFSILEILQDGYRPSVLFLMEEEIGGFGARHMIKDYPVLPKGVNFLVELDRQGEKDAVYYGCGNEVFANFIESFGFESSWGTFSDISIIAPAWDIAAVNLSIGYFNEHTHAEFLNYEYMFDTIYKVERILDNCGDTLYHYEPWKGNEEWFDLTPREVDGKVQCDSCDEWYDKDQIVLAKDHFEGDIWRLCPVCLKLNEGIVEAI